MSNSINTIILVGHLGSKPELKQTDTTSIATLNLATNRKVKRGDEYIEQTDWHRIVCFGNTANYIANYADKGSLISIEGRLQTRGYEQNGEKRYITEVIANRANILSKAKTDNHAPSPVDKKTNDTFADDIPF